MPIIAAASDRQAPLCPPDSPFLLALPPPGTTDPSTVSVVQLSPECHIVEKPEYVAFSESCFLFFFLFLFQDDSRYSLTVSGRIVTLPLNSMIDASPIESPGTLWPCGSDSVGPGWGPRCCISSTPPGSLHAGQGPHLQGVSGPWVGAS